MQGWSGCTGMTSDGDERAYTPNDAALEADETLTTTAALSPRYERLTRDNTILLLIDHQIGPLWDLESSASRRRVVELARLAQTLDIPTVVTAIAPETCGPVIPELGVVVDDSRILVRRTANAWDDARIRSAVAASGRRKLIVAGGVVEVGVALCALAAAHAGYEVYAPIDASGQASHPALLRLSRAGVIVTTASLVSAELVNHESETREQDRRGTAASAGHPSMGEALKRRLRSSRRRRP